MSYAIRNPGPLVSMDEVCQFERALGVHFPDDYREFLVRTNGGRPSPKSFWIDSNPIRRIGQVLDFFGINDLVESCRLDWNYRTFMTRVPAQLFPVGCEDGGNLICISLNPLDGGVYYWDHDREHSPPTFKNVFKIESTFSDFLNALFHAEARP